MSFLSWRKTTFRHYAWSIDYKWGKGWTNSYEREVDKGSNLMLVKCENPSFSGDITISPTLKLHNNLNFFSLCNLYIDYNIAAPNTLKGTIPFNSMNVMELSLSINFKWGGCSTMILSVCTII